MARISNRNTNVHTKMYQKISISFFVHVHIRDTKFHPKISHKKKLFFRISNDVSHTMLVVTDQRRTHDDLHILHQSSVTLPPQLRDMYWVG